MSIDPQVISVVVMIVVGLLTIVCGILGWGMRSLVAAVRQLERDVADLRECLPTDYIRWDRSAQLVQPIVQRLDDLVKRFDLWDERRLGARHESD